jgi:uncharacterized protein (DUF2235 family)
MPKTIAIFTDGTGNSARSLFKTNVWRLYQALDLTHLSPGHSNPSCRQQIAYYQDGIGTSTFKPLAIIGGAFGWGLKRNVIDAYIYLCQVHEPGDEIFLFGFSRGGFTARVLLGLILDQGLLTCRHKTELYRYAPDAYRQFRHRLKQAGQHIDLLRRIRDSYIAQWRDIFKQPHYSEVSKRNRQVEVKLIGVWDTVSAYGLPIAELTRGIDRWIWPLSMPDNRLPEGVEIARHALALDDEREAFHPLLWNEINSLNPSRILQVWFAGMHADVGGGYPHEGLALFPLAWMMREAAQAGLRFKATALEQTEALLGHSAPMHDSRRFLGAYYRYQPRRIGAFMSRPAPDTIAMRSVPPEEHGLIEKVKVHESVLQRIYVGPDRYAPIALPSDFILVGQSKPDVTGAGIVADDQDKIWDLVWYRRGVYFVTLTTTLQLIAYPLFIEANEACEDPQCLLVPVVLGIGSFLPGVLRFWAQGFGSAPAAGLFLALVLVGLLLWGHYLQRRIHDEMRDALEKALGIANSDPVDETVAEVTTAIAANPFAEMLPSKRIRVAVDSFLELWGSFPKRLWQALIQRVSNTRRNLGYQSFFWRVRWWFMPNFFGLAMLSVTGIVALAIGITTVARVKIGHNDRVGTYCDGSSDPSPLGNFTVLAKEFRTDSICWSTGILVQRGKQYRIFLESDS